MHPAIDRPENFLVESKEGIHRIWSVLPRRMRSNVRKVFFSRGQVQEEDERPFGSSGPADQSPELLCLFWPQIIRLTPIVRGNVLQSIGGQSVEFFQLAGSHPASPISDGNDDHSETKPKHYQGGDIISGVTKPGS